MLTHSHHLVPHLQQERRKHFTITFKHSSLSSKNYGDCVAVGMRGVSLFRECDLVLCMWPILQTSPLKNNTQDKLKTTVPCKYVLYEEQTSILSSHVLTKASISTTATATIAAATTTRSVVVRATTISTTTVTAIA